MHHPPNSGSGAVGSALHLGCRGRRFESSLPDYIEPSSNGKTLDFGSRNQGSNPCGSTNYYGGVAEWTIAVVLKTIGV